VCVPDADARAAQYKSQLGKTLGYYGNGYTDQNALGVLIGYSSYEVATTDYTNFMEDSFSMASAFAYHAATGALGSDQARAEAFILWRMKHIVGRMGTQSGYCYRQAANYTCRYADTNLSGVAVATFNASVYADWATVYTKTFGVANTCDSSTALGGSSGGDPLVMSTDPYPYWGLVHSALAYAVDVGAPGASAAWTRLIGASNYSPSGFNNMPLWGVVPR
jgi:hypothetical protein